MTILFTDVLWVPWCILSLIFFFSEKFADVLLSWSREPTKTQFVSRLKDGEYYSHVVPRIR